MLTRFAILIIIIINVIFIIINSILIKKTIFIAPIH